MMMPARRPKTQSAIVCVYMKYPITRTLQSVLTTVMKEYW
jgi:hypothetical protein